MNFQLRAKVENDLRKKYSPEQIAGRLKREFPNREEMRVSPETIYQSLYVQSRGGLKQELTRYLRTGRGLRHPSRKTGQRKNRIPDMINISERPPEAADRAVPGIGRATSSSARATSPRSAPWWSGRRTIRCWCICQAVTRPRKPAMP